MPAETNTSATGIFAILSLLLGGVGCILGLMFTFVGVVAVLTGDAFGHSGGIPVVLGGAVIAVAGFVLARAGKKKLK